MRVRFFLCLTCLILTTLIIGCSSSSTPEIPSTDGDSDLIVDGDNTPLDGDEDESDLEDIGPGCLQRECLPGLYCDTNDRRCKNCTEDHQCGDPNPVERTFPVCVEGLCTTYTCGGIVDPPVPANGVELTTSLVFADFNAEGEMIIDSKEVFPIGVQNLHKNLYQEAHDSGANLLLSGAGCCMVSDDEQQTFLADALHYHMYGSVHALWPYDKIDIMDEAVIGNSITARYNIISMLFWLGGDRAQEVGEVNQVAAIKDRIHRVSNKKPFAIAEDSGFDVSAYDGIADFFIVSLDPQSLAPGSEISRVRNANSSRPVWARLWPDKMSEAKMKAAAVQAMSVGATGIVFEMLDESDKSPEEWGSVKATTRYLRNLTNVLMAEKQPSIVEIEPANSVVRYMVSEFDSKTYFAFFVNASDENQKITVTIRDSLAKPYCRGVMGEDTVLHLTKDATFDLDLAPNSILIYQLSVPGETGSNR